MAPGEEFHHVHEAPDRGLRARAYVYEVGSYHYNWHPEPELSVVVTGEVEVCTPGSVVVLGPGDVYLINSGDGHATLARRPRSTVLLLHLDPTHLAGFTGQVPRFACRSQALTRAAAPFARLRALLAGMVLTEAAGPAQVAAWEARLLEVVALLFAHFLDPEAAGAPPAEEANHALRRAVTHVDERFRKRITLEQLGRAARYHPGYLSALFSQRLGMTSSEYITRVRLRHATRDLSDRRARVADIAAANGFADVKAFNIAFKRTFGKSPTQYRAQITAAAVAADEVFHERFVRRDDPGVRSVLNEFARTDAIAGAGGVAGPARTDVADESAVRALRQAALAAQELADRLADLAGPHVTSKS